MTRATIAAVAILIFAALLASPVPLAPSATQTAGRPQVTSPILTTRDKGLLAEALRLKSALGDEVWPGLGAEAIPVILYNDAYEFLTGMQDPPPPPWALVENDDLAGAPYYRRPAGRPQSFAVEVGDVWVASLSSLDRMAARIPIKISPDVYAVLLLHEVFHAFQARRYAPRFRRALALYALEKSYPTSDPEFAKSWTAEGALLRSALTARDDGEALAAVRAFLESRRARLSKVPFGFAVEDYENEMEWLEGLGKYTEIRSYELAAARALAPDPAYASFKPGLPFWSGDFVRLERMLGSLPGDQRFYLSGMAKARILDRLSPGWKDGFFQAGGSLDDRLRAVVEGR